MRVVRKRKVLALEIEYEAHRGKNELEQVKEWLDKEYGQSQWRAVGTRPKDCLTKSRLTVEVNI